MFSRLPREYCYRRSPAGKKIMVGRGLEPRQFGLQPSALPVKLTNHKLMSVVGFEPTTSGFVDQRSKFRCATRTKSGWLELNQREPVPKTGGRPLSHILKNGAGGIRTRNYWFAGPAPYRFGHDPKLFTFTSNNYATWHRSSCSILIQPSNPPPNLTTKHCVADAYSKSAIR